MVKTNIKVPMASVKRVWLRMVKSLGCNLDHQSLIILLQSLIIKIPWALCILREGNNRRFCQSCITPLASEADKG
jgi:hypothetical protein